MTGIDDLASFLRAQLDDDERVARDCAGTWRFDGGSGEIIASDRRSAEVVGKIRWVHIGAHIARWDPARVLAEIEAKRRILDWCNVMSPDHAISDTLSNEARYVLRTIALAYAGRDGWREEWRP